MYDDAYVCVYIYIYICAHIIHIIKWQMEMMSLLSLWPDSRPWKPTLEGKIYSLDHQNGLGLRV